MVIFTAISLTGVAVAGYFGATLAVGTFSAFALGLASQVVLGLALNALTPKPSNSTARRGYSVNSFGSALDHQVIYGRMKVGGAVVYDNATGENNKFLHRIIAFAGHEIDSFDEIYINDEVVTLDVNGNVTSPDRYDGVVTIKEKLGAADQAAETTLVDAGTEWTANHRLRGIAYLYVKLKFDPDAFPNGVPVITAVVKGKKVFDPRTDTTVWSSNPALCTRDYLTNTNYGMGEATASIDDTVVSVAANVCDFFDYPTLTGDPRFTCNGAFTTSSTPYGLLGDLGSSMAGLVWYGQGKWRMKPGYYVAPTVDLTNDDFRSSVSVSTRHSRRDNFNTVKGTFKGSETNWQITDYPQVTNTAFVAEDNDQESTADIDLPYTSDSVIARRIARIALERNRQQLTISASFGLKAFQVQVGDIVTLTNQRFGWSSKEFEVTSWTFGLTNDYDLQTNLTLREISESVFDDVSDGIVYTRDNTNLISPFDVPTVGLAVEALIQVSNQKVSNIGVATVTSGRSEAVDYVEVDYKLSSDTVYSSFGQGQLGEFRVRDLEVNTYDFRARAVNTFGIKGEFTVLLDQEINAFAGDPSDVASLEKEISGGTLFLSWPPIPDPDLSHYQVKHNSNTTGATWSNSTTVIEKIGRPATSATVPARSGTFLIRAYDKEGNFSVDPTSVVILPSEIPQLGVNTTITEDPDFLGDKTNNILLVGSTIEIDDTSAASPTGEYLFDDIIDTATSRIARITGFRTFTRKFDGGTILWGNVPQLFDTWPGNFDTWTDEDAAFGDVSVVVYVSATEDDPAGTPTWGPYVLANGATVEGRAFRFKAILTSTNTNYMPSVSELSVEVSY